MFKSLFTIMLSFGLMSSFLIPTALPVYDQDEIPNSEFEQAVITPKPKPKVTYDGIRQVVCGDSKGRWTGTMVHIADRTYMTAYHVAEDGVCFDIKTNTKLTLSYLQPELDFAVFTAPFNLDNRILKIKCKPLTTGKTYYSIGYPGPNLVVTDLIANSNYTGLMFYVPNMTPYHLRELSGHIYPGMSGGPMVDEAFNVYGINSVANQEKGWIRELKDTALCN